MIKEACQLSISSGSVKHIVVDVLGSKRVEAKIVPEMLNFEAYTSRLVR